MSRQWTPAEEIAHNLLVENQYLKEENAKLERYSAADQQTIALLRDRLAAAERGIKRLSGWLGPLIPPGATIADLEKAQRPHE